MINLSTHCIGSRVALVMEQLQGKLLTMDGPATYRIIVRGLLDLTWVSRLGGMTLSERQSGDGNTDTILVGQLPDQAALSRVLNALYELHLPVFSVEFLKNDSVGSVDELSPSSRIH
jgi:hypothetical protein